MARLTKAERQLEAAKRRQSRIAAREELQGQKVRVGIGFAAGYIGEKIATEFLPNVADTTIDLALAGGGGYLAFTNEDDLGDYALGAALVGTTQTLDRIWETVRGLLNRNGA